MNKIQNNQTEKRPLEKKRKNCPHRLSFCGSLTKKINKLCTSSKVEVLFSFQKKKKKKNNTNP